MTKLNIELSASLKRREVRATVSKEGSITDIYGYEFDRRSLASFQRCAAQARELRRGFYLAIERGQP